MVAVAVQLQRDPLDWPRNIDACDEPASVPQLELSDGAIDAGGSQYGEQIRLRKAADVGERSHDRLQPADSPSILAVLARESFEPADCEVPPGQAMTYEALQRLIGDRAAGEIENRS